MELFRASLANTKALSVDRQALEESMLAENINYRVQEGKFRASDYISEEFGVAILAKLRNLGYNVTFLGPSIFDTAEEIELPSTDNIVIRFLKRIVSLISGGNGGSVPGVPTPPPPGPEPEPGPPSVAGYYMIDWEGAVDIVNPPESKKARKKSA